MAKKANYKELLLVVPELEGFELDGSTDYQRISTIVDTNNPKVVWRIVNILQRQQAKKPANAKLEALLDL